MSDATEDLRNFEQFMQRRAQAAQAFVRGDFAPLGRMVARVSPATFFGPLGGHRQGADDVSSAYAGDAALFESAGENQFEILQMGASNGIAYWVGFQRVTAQLHGRSGPIPFNLRVTEVFRREEGEWKLVHRHADSLASRPEQVK